MLEAMFTVSVFLELTWIVPVPRSIKLWSALLQCQRTLQQQLQCNYSSQYNLQPFFSWYNSRFQSSLAILPTKQFTHHLHVKKTQVVMKLCMLLTQHCIFFGAVHWLSSLWNSKTGCKKTTRRKFSFLLFQFWLKSLTYKFCENSSSIYKGQSLENI